MRPDAPLQRLDEALGGRYKVFRIHGLPPHDVVVLRYWADLSTRCHGRRMIYRFWPIRDPQTP